MSHILAGTHVVSLDEPCKMLAELNFQSPGSRGWRRYQIIIVMRNDQETECRIDLGPAKAFKASPIRIPGGVQDETTGRYDIVETVGRLLEIADAHRAGLFTTQPELEPRLNLVESYHDEMDARPGRRVGRKSFGHGSVMRRVD